MTNATALFFPAFTLLAAGCSPLLYTPPAQLTVGGAPATLEQGEHAIVVQAAESHYYEDTASTSLSGQYRYGLTEPSELIFEGSAVFAHTDQVEPPVAALLSAGFKYELGTPHLSSTLRAGLGLTPLGTNVGADLIISAGYENPYVVPYFNARLGISQPIHASTILLENVGGNSDENQWHQARGAIFVSASPGVEFRFDDAFVDVSVMIGNSIAHGPSTWDIDQNAHTGEGSESQTHAALNVAFGHKL